MMTSALFVSMGSDGHKCGKATSQWQQAALEEEQDGPEDKLGAPVPSQMGTYFWYMPTPRGCCCTSRACSDTFFVFSGDFTLCRAPLKPTMVGRASGWCPEAAGSLLAICSEFWIVTAHSWWILDGSW